MKWNTKECSALNVTPVHLRSPVRVADVYQPSSLLHIGLVAKGSGCSGRLLASQFKKATSGFLFPRETAEFYPPAEQQQSPQPELGRSPS